MKFTLALILALFTTSVSAANFSFVTWNPYVGGGSIITRFENCTSVTYIDAYEAVMRVVCPDNPIVDTSQDLSFPVKLKTPWSGTVEYADGPFNVNLPYITKGPLANTGLHTIAFSGCGVIFFIDDFTVQDTSLDCRMRFSISAP